MAALALLFAACDRSPSRPCLDVVLPPGPTSLSAQPGDSLITVSWTTPNDHDIAGVRILRRAGTYPESPFDPLATVIVQGSGSPWVDRGLANLVTYYYRCWTYDACAQFSRMAAQASASPAPTPDTTPPGAPQGLYSVTGDRAVTLRWLPNPEPDVAGYAIFIGPCPSGPACPYDLYGRTAETTVTVTGLVNGVTRYFAVAAFDTAGNEGPLSVGDVYDTPRPAGANVSLGNAHTSVVGAGWDFSAATKRSSTDPSTDVYYYAQPGGAALLVCPDVNTNIQDMGAAGTLDAIDYAPITGWSPTGTAEAIAGHNYVVWTRDNHFAKVRVTSVSPSALVFDWAYQVDPGNRELGARRVSRRLEASPAPAPPVRRAP